MKKKYYIETQGCQMNEYDSDKMKDLLSKEMNFVNTDIKEEADVLIVNTCSIREKAQEKVECCRRNFSPRRYVNG